MSIKKIKLKVYTPLVFFYSVKSVGNAQNCNTFLAVYNGAYAGGTPYRKYCGSPAPKVPELLRIPGPIAFIVYQSEENISRGGFQAEVSCKQLHYVMTHMHDLLIYVDSKLDDYCNM